MIFEATPYISLARKHVVRVRVRVRVEATPYMSLARKHVVERALE